MSAYDIKRLELATLRYIARNGIPPMLSEVANNASMTVNMAHTLAQQSHMLQLTWTGPRPALGKIIVEVVEDEAQSA